MTKLRVLAVLGVAAILGWAFFPRMTWVLNYHTQSGITINGAQAHAICNSTLGIFGQAMSATVASKCALINNFYTFCMILGIVGVVLLVFSAYLAWKGKSNDTTASEPAHGPYTF